VNLKDIAEKNQLPYATFNRRLYAMTVDVLVFIVFATPFMKIFSYYIMGDIDMARVMTELSLTSMNQEVKFEDFWAKIQEHNLLVKYLITLSAMIALLFVYEFFFWTKFNSTPGKMLFACRIVDVKTGNPPSKKQYIVRFAAYIVSTLPIYLGFFAIYWSKRRQTWHDKLAGVAVITVQREYAWFGRLRDKVKAKFFSCRTNRWCK
jgi:uncharacterized RDD family membrane protein YckC